jgi:hypothetical protein
LAGKDRIFKFRNAALIFANVSNILRKSALLAQIFEIRKIHFYLSSKHPFQSILKVSAKKNEKFKSLRLFGGT